MIRSIFIFQSGFSFLSDGSHHQTLCGHRTFAVIGVLSFLHDKNFLSQFSDPIFTTKTFCNFVTILWFTLIQADFNLIHRYCWTSVNPSINSVKRVWWVYVCGTLLAFLLFHFNLTYSHVLFDAIYSEVIHQSCKAIL